MTLESLKVKEIYQGNGATTVFPIPFAYSSGDNLILLYTDARGKTETLTSNYKITVTSSGDTSVIYPLIGDPMSHGTKITVYRKTPQTQIVDLTAEGDFNPEVLEKDGFDRTVMMIQEQQEAIERSIKIPMSSEDTPEELLEEIFASRDKAVQASAEAKEALTSATEQANIATTSADKSTDKAQEAIKAAEQALNAVKNIDGFANATHTFHGIKLDEQMNLLWVKGEDGESFNAKDFLFSAILPTEARFFLDRGQLFVELPFTQ